MGCHSGFLSSGQIPASNQAVSSRLASPKLACDARSQRGPSSTCKLGIHWQCAQPPPGLRSTPSPVLASFRCLSQLARESLLHLSKSVICLGKTDIERPAISSLAMLGQSKEYYHPSPITCFPKRRLYKFRKTYLLKTFDADISAEQVETLHCCIHTRLGVKGAEIEYPCNFP
jgi:hypothetical protein